MSDFSYKKHIRGKWFFLGTFIFACFLFWWLPSILFRVVIHQADTVEFKSIVISASALIFFITGYLLPMPNQKQKLFCERSLDSCEDFAYKVTIFLAIPAFVLASIFWYSHSSLEYGTGETIPSLYQAVLYSHLFFGFMYIGAAHPEKQGWYRVATAVLLVTLPRLIISLHWGRFFLAQAIVPVVFIAIARGWIHLSVKRAFQLIFLSIVIVFVPALSRGGSFSNQSDIAQFFSAGSSLGVFQDNLNLDLDGKCPPLLVSLTAKIVPYHGLGLCEIDVWGLTAPATLDRILAHNDPDNYGLLTGPGSNYLLELYLSGGFLAVIAGSALFGLSCRHFIDWIGRRSLFSGIWAECLTRAIFAPRSNLGYVYERIPSLVFVTMLVIFVVWSGRFLKEENSVLQWGSDHV